MRPEDPICLDCQKKYHPNAFPGIRSRTPPEGRHITCSVCYKEIQEYFVTAYLKPVVKRGVMLPE